jgi:hypothetical protein
LPECIYRLSVRCNHPVVRGDTDDARCASCDRYKGSPRGLGDTVHAALGALGVHRIVSDCGGCAKRRAALNAAVPFTDKPKEG